MAWFKQKRYGFGAAPASWQGWALTFAYIAGVMALGVWMSADENLVATRAPIFIMVTLGLTVVFVAIAWRTTEGGRRWRWGKD